VGQAGVEAVEAVLRQAGEQLAREPAVAVHEFLSGGAAPFCERDQCRAATGRAIEYVSHEFYRIADGLIAEEWICSDMATLLRQLS
jgi:hypothetical protein